MLKTPILLVALCSVPELASARADDPGGVEWYQGSYFSARGKARAEKKLLAVVFVAEWSDWSRRLVDETFAEANVRTALESVICFKAEATTRDGQRVADRLPVRTYPTIFFLGTDGRPEELVEGFISAPSLLSELTRIQAGQGTRSAMERAVASNPTDIYARLVLAQKLGELGEGPARDEQIAKVNELDPTGESLPRRQFEMRRVRADMVSKFDDSKNLYDTTPLEGLLESAQHPEILFEGWTYLGNLYSKISRPEDARAAFQKAWDVVPPDQVIPFGTAVAQGFFGMRDSLDDKERRFALSVATKVRETAEATPLKGATLAPVLDALACAYFINGQVKEAVATAERCVELAPGQEAYVLRLAAFRAGG